MNGRSVITKAEAGRTLAAVVRGRLGVSWSEARRLIESRRVLLGASPCLDPACRVAAGQRLEIQREASPTRQRGKKQAPSPTRRAARQESSPLNSSALVYVDDAVVVVDKPAGLTTMRHPEEAAEFGARGRRFLPRTLADLLPPLLPGPDRRVTPVHRLDKETSGLVVFARTPDAAQQLGRQFRKHTVERRYLALVRGRAEEARIESWLLRDRGDGRRGSGPAGEGQRAVTHVRVVERLGDFTLVECRLETGRTHQVRIHLGEAGTPLCGERLYDRPLNGRPLPDDSGAARVMLHAATLGFAHPDDGERMSWAAPPPADMGSLLTRLRNHAADSSASD